MDLDRQIKTTRSCTLNGDNPGVQLPDSGITRPDFGTAARAAAVDTPGFAGKPRHPARRSLCLRALLVLLVICAALLGSPRAAWAQADTTPPALESATVLADGASIELVFDEPFDIFIASFPTVSEFP